MSKTVLFQTIQFSIGTLVISIDRNLSGTTTPGHGENGSDGNERVLNIPQSSIITETSRSDCLVSYPGQSLVGVLTLQQKSSRCLLLSQLTGQFELNVISVH